MATWVVIPKMQRRKVGTVFKILFFLLQKFPECFTCGYQSYIFNCNNLGNVSNPLIFSSKIFTLGLSEKFF